MMKVGVSPGMVEVLFHEFVQEKQHIDIVVEARVSDLLRMVNLKGDLEGLLHSRVDFVRYRLKMNAYLKKRIDSEAYYV